MQMFPKTVEMFLVNGTAEGLIIAEMRNWNGKAFKLHRQDVSGCDEEELSAVGVYFLFGQATKSGDPCVYIGESEDVKTRLLQHINDAAKEQFDWNTAVCFFGKDLNKASVRYLEDRLVKIAHGAGRYEVMTQKTFKKMTLKRSDVCAMDEFIFNIKILIRALGYDVLAEQEKIDSKTRYFVCVGSGAKATGYPTKDGFVVIKGSIVSDHLVNCFKGQCSANYNKRMELEGSGTIVDRVFTRDYTFTSPSGASSVVLGRPSNGYDDWRTNGKQKLADFRE